MNRRLFLKTTLLAVALLSFPDLIVLAKDKTPKKPKTFKGLQENNVLYRYKAKVLKVVDGDTVDCRVELGFKVQQEIRFRLDGIDAPETRGEERPEGLKSKEWLEKQLSGVEWVYLVSERTGKYGRWLAHIYLTPESRSLNEQMIELGLAKPYGE